MTITENLNKVEHNVFYRMVATLLTPILLTICSTLFFLNLGDIKDSQKELKENQDKASMQTMQQALDINTIKGDVKGLKERLDYSLLQRLQTLETKVDRMEQRGN